MNPEFSADSPYISLLSDYGFKATFGNRHNTLFLRRALQALLQSPVAIDHVEFGPTTFEGDTLGSRSGLYDLSCTDAAGRHFLVEMQVGPFPAFLQRMKFYAFTKFNSLVRRGQFDYGSLPPIISIGILRHSLFPELPGYHHTASLRTDAGELLDTQLRFITVELSKFDETAPRRTELEQLLYVMKTLHLQPDPTRLPPDFDADWIQAALQELDRSALSPDERMMVELRLSDEINAERRLQTELAEERAKGEAKGKAETIRQLLRESPLSAEDIARYTDTPLAYVQQLQAEVR